MTTRPDGPPNPLDDARRTAPCHSPLRYAGGKFWMRNQILPLIPPHEHYVEPFSGGASVFFLQGGSAAAHLNDLDSDLITCLQHIRDTPEPLMDRLLALPVDRGVHRRLRDELVQSDGLHRAARYFYLNQTSFSGITHSPRCYWATRSPRTATHAGWAKRIGRASARLQGVRLTNEDFEGVIEAAPDGAFLFVDAPYLTARHYKYYAHSFSWADHVRLAACLQRHRHRLRFLATYDDSTLIRGLYDWAPHVTAVRRPNTIARTDNRVISGHVPPQRSVGRDLLIRNYDARPSRKWAIIPHQPTDQGFDALADAQWATVSPLLPALPRRADNRGRPWRDSRGVLDGVLWVLSRGVPWHMLPSPRYPPYQTCHRRYLRWLGDGTLAAVLTALTRGDDLRPSWAAEPWVLALIRPLS